MQFTSPGPQCGSVVAGKAQVTSATYHAEGKHLFVASSDNRLQLINCETGKSTTPSLRFEREGLSLVEATHHNQCILFAGSKGEQSHSINYHSSYDNKILRKFRGHTQPVTNVSMCPTDDSFLTSSKDRTVRLWNLQQAGSVAKMDLPPQTTGDVIACYDSTGLVFGVTASMAGTQGHYLHLYDARNYGGGAFAEIKVSAHDLEKSVTNKQARAKWTSMKFNSSGNSILITGDEGLAITLDGYEGTLQRSVSGQGVECACWAADDKTLLTGNQDGTISCWNTDTGAMIKKLEGHPGRVSWVGVNPRLSMFASCDTNVALWVW